MSELFITPFGPGSAAWLWGGAQSSGAGAFDPVSFISTILFSLLIPIAILIGRHNVKKYRQRLLKNLEDAYKTVAGPSGQNIHLVPSFEIARYKYDLPTDEPQPGGSQPGERRVAFYRPSRLGEGWLYGILIYLMPIFIFVVLSALGFYTMFALAEATEPWARRSFLLLGLYPWGSSDAVEYQTQTATVVCVAFLGAYVWSIIYLLRRIANYDLSPLSFLRVSAQILLACFLVAVTRHVVHAGMGLAGSQSTSGGAAFIGVAFLMGFFPTLGINYLVTHFPSLQLKRSDPDAPGLSRNLPLDMIDGLDSYIIFRLAEMEIEDVQNLATANPILLFIETPYGLFEAVDWVGQAQLIAAVGPRKAKLLRDIGIRNVFDLSRAAHQPALRKRLAAILFNVATPADADIEAVKTLVEAIASNLPVRRLRQVWNAILFVLEPWSDAPPNDLWAEVRFDADAARIATNGQGAPPPSPPATPPSAGPH